MANARNKAVDNTHLSLDQAEKRGFLHRDYLAHAFRWTHVVKYLMQGHRYKTANILDIGCGKELPLARMMYSSRMTHTTGSYTGVDVNKLEWPDSIPKDTKKFNLNLLGKTDVTKLGDSKFMTNFDVIVCFEVIEHVEPYHAFQILREIAKRLKEFDGDGRAFISTPNYDPKVGAADNHVNEMEVMVVQVLMKLAGLYTIHHYGTFASQKDLKLIMTKEHLEIFDELKNYYDSNVLSTFFAPLYPLYSRNSIRVVCTSSPDEEIEENLISWLKKQNPTDASSSARWKSDLTKIIKEVRRDRRCSK